MIKIRSTEVIGTNLEESDQALFTLRMYDSRSASLKVNTVVSHEMIKEFTSSINKAFEVLMTEQDCTS